ncbi:MAG: cytochrome c [Pseudomonadota bacterium]
MRRTITTLLVAAGVALTTNVVMADGHSAALEKAIKSRKGLMQIYSFTLSGLGAMAKGEKEYDAKLAASLAGALENASKSSIGAMWPQGSDSTAMPGKTRAKVEAWTTYPKVAEAQNALLKASAALAAGAGDGKDGLGALVGAVGKSCGGCHKPFREEKK